MKTIDEKIKNSQRWRKAQENLDNFMEMIMVVKQYPIKPIEQPLPSPPYSPQESYKY